MVISDFTGQFWVNCFDQQAVQIFGMTADELHSEIENADDDNEKRKVFDRFCSAVRYHQFRFKLNIRTENYQDELRKKTRVVSAEKLEGDLYLEEMTRYLADW